MTGYGLPPQPFTNTNLFSNWSQFSSIQHNTAVMLSFCDKWHKCERDAITLRLPHNVKVSVSMSEQFPRLASLKDLLPHCRLLTWGIIQARCCWRQCTSLHPYFTAPLLGRIRTTDKSPKMSRRAMHMLLFVFFCFVFFPGRKMLGVHLLDRTPWSQMSSSFKRKQLNASSPLFL